jgi:pilus assembly protein CpaF
MESLLPDDSLSEIMRNPDATWGYEREMNHAGEATILLDVGKLRADLEVIAN